MAKRKIRILHVTHNYVSTLDSGDVESYVDRLVRHLPSEYESYVFYPDGPKPESEEVILLNTATGSESRHMFERAYDPYAVSDLDREIWFSKILHEERIDIVCFHHLMHHPLSLPLVPRSMGIPVILSLLDFYPVCPHYNLTNNEQRYNNVTALPLVACEKCLGLQEDAIQWSLASRRSFIRGVLENIDLTIFFSQSEYEIVKSVYPTLRDSSRILVEGHCSLDEQIKVMTGVYERFIKEYRLRDREKRFFSEPPSARPASAGNIYRNSAIWLDVAHEKRPKAEQTEVNQQAGFRSLLFNSMRRLAKVCVI